MLYYDGHSLWEQETLLGEYFQQKKRPDVALIIQHPGMYLVSMKITNEKDKEDEDNW